MREIKFRAWDGIGNHGMQYYDSLDEIEAYFRSHKFQDVMQYTGLKDKNGKEIYEHDIVRDLTSYADLYETKGLYENNRVVIPLLVAWVETEARFMLYGDFNREEWYYQYSDQIYDRRLEIIGNIYATPELMDYEYGKPRIENE